MRLWAERMWVTGGVYDFPDSVIRSLYALYLIVPILLRILHLKNHNDGHDSLHMEIQNIDNQARRHLNPLQLVQRDIIRCDYST